MRVQCRLCARDNTRKNGESGAGHTIPCSRQAIGPAPPLFRAFVWTPQVNSPVPVTATPPAHADLHAQIADVARAKAIENALGPNHRVLGRIGSGGMAEVWRVRQSDLARDVALKVLRTPDVEVDFDFEERFRREARALGALSHPNIVAVHDVGSMHDGSVFIAMEYVRGASLADHLGVHGRMSSDQFLPLAVQACSALQYAHDRNIVHLDLKPANLMVTQDHEGQAQAKLLDFGIAAMMDTGSGAHDTDQLVGTAHVMAPEQIDGTPVDARTDVYGFGVLMYRVMEDTWPFRGKLEEVLEGHLLHEAPRMQRVPGPVADVVAKCLAKAPEDRFQSMEAVAAAIRSAAPKLFQGSEATGVSPWIAVGVGLSVGIPLGLAAMAAMQITFARWDAPPTTGVSAAHGVHATANDAAPERPSVPTLRAVNKPVPPPTEPDPEPVRKHRGLRAAQDEAPLSERIKIHRSPVTRP